MSLQLFFNYASDIILTKQSSKRSAERDRRGFGEGERLISFANR
jgi:hypothetical protein